jgi:hypothetical protein
MNKQSVATGLGPLLIGWPQSPLAASAALEVSANAKAATAIEAKSRVRIDI